MHVKHLAELPAHKKNMVGVCYRCCCFCIPSAWPEKIWSLLKGWKLSISKGECGMSFLMVFRGELVTDPGWGLLCAIMGSGQGSPVAWLSPTLLLFRLRAGDGMIRGECPNVHHGAGTGTVSREPTARESAGPSLPRCPNPVLKRFLRSHPSPESCHAPSAAVSTNRATPSAAAPCGGYVKHLAFSGSDWKLLLKN